MRVGECMKREVVTVTAEMTVPEAARVIAERRVGTLPVVGPDGRLEGVVTLLDILRVFMPDFVELLDNIDFVHDFGALEDLQPRDVPEAAQLTVREIMEPPVAVDQEAGLLRACVLMFKHRLQDLPVVDKGGRLVGLVSRVDIGAAFLAAWATEDK